MSSGPCVAEFVPSLGPVGMLLNDLAVGASGELHLLGTSSEQELFYLRHAAGTLKQVRVDTHAFGALAVDSTGNAHILYSSSGQVAWATRPLRYARVKGMSLAQNVTLEPAAYAAFDVVVDQDDRVLAGYAIHPAGSEVHPLAARIRVAEKAKGGAWSAAHDVADRVAITSMQVVVDPVGRVHFGCLFDLGAGEYVVYSSTDPGLSSWDGTQAGWANLDRLDELLAVDSMNVLHTLTFHNGQVGYGTRPAGDATAPWQQETYGLRQSEAGGIAVDSEGRAHLVFAPLFETRRTLVHIQRGGGSWSAETEVGSDFNGLLRVAIDGRNALHLVYTTTAGQIAYRRICL